MKLKIITSFFFCFVQFSFGQTDIQIQKSGNERLIKALNNAEQIAENNENYLSVRVYKLDNGHGSAGNPSCEVSHNILVAISEFDLAPKQSLFEIGPFINPEFMNWTKVKEYERNFEIKHGNYDDRKELRLKVDLNKLIITESK